MNESFSITNYETQLWEPLTIEAANKLFFDGCDWASEEHYNRVRSQGNVLLCKLKDGRVIQHHNLP